MKLTKEQWKQLSDRIFLTLRPTQHPVAMKFIKTPEEFDAIPDIEFCQNKASTCKLIAWQRTPGHVRPDADHFSGYYCAMNNGCMELTQEFLDGAILYKQPTPWHPRAGGRDQAHQVQPRVHPGEALRRHRLLLAVQLQYRRAGRHLPAASDAGGLPPAGLLCRDRLAEA